LRVPSTPSASLSRLSLHDALPILLVLWRRKYRLHRGRIYLAQTGEGFVYTFLLIGKMRKIIHVLPFAPTTHAKMITKRCYPMRRRLIDLTDTGFRKISLLPRQLNIHHVARDRLIDKNHEVVDLCHALAPFRDVHDRNTFQQPLFGCQPFSTHKAHKGTGFVVV